MAAGSAKHRGRTIEPQSYESDDGLWRPKAVVGTNQGGSVLTLPIVAHLGRAGDHRSVRRQQFRSGRAVKPAAHTCRRAEARSPMERSVPPIAPRRSRGQDHPAKTDKTPTKLTESCRWSDHQRLPEPVCEDSREHYESGGFFLERLGAERYLDPKLMATLWSLRQRLIAEWALPRRPR
jgi:hypothetical protein